MSKQEVMDIIRSMPDNTSFDDIIYNLYLTNNIKKGLDDIAEGRTYTQEEIKALFA